MNKLKYIVNIDIDAATARARQVSATAKALHQLLGPDFELIPAAGGEDAFVTTVFDQVNRCERSTFRKLYFSKRILRHIRNLEDGTLYSRNLFVLLIGRCFGCDLVWEAHDAVSAANLRILRAIQDRLRVVVISGGLRKYLVDQIGLSPERVHIAHDGVWMERYDKLRGISKKALRSDVGLPRDKFIIMHAGSMYRGRGMELFELILDEFPDCILVQVGGRECDARIWRDRYSSFSNMVFVPRQSHDELVKYQMAADLLFLPMTRSSPIWWCTSPMKLFEYMATGVPILASTVGSVGEVINDDRAVVFDPDDSQTLVDGLSFCLSNTSETSSRADAALAEVRQHYTWQRRAASICEFLGLHRAGAAITLQRW